MCRCSEIEAHWHHHYRDGTRTINWVQRHLDRPDFPLMPPSSNSTMWPHYPLKTIINTDMIKIPVVAFIILTLSSQDPHTNIGSHDVEWSSKYRQRILLCFLYTNLPCGCLPNVTVIFFARRFTFNTNLTQLCLHFSAFSDNSEGGKNENFFILRMFSCCDDVINTIEGFRTDRISRVSSSG